MQLPRYYPSPKHIDRPRTKYDCQHGPCYLPSQGKVGEANLPDILVSYSAYLLDVCRALRDVLERVSKQLQLILLIL